MMAVKNRSPFFCPHSRHLLAFAYIGIFFSTSQAIEIEKKVLERPTQTCAVRLSTEHMNSHHRPDETKMPNFCSGTVVDANTIVIAAHCLSEVFYGINDAENIESARSVEIAIGNAGESARNSIKAGSNAIVTSAQFKTSEQRMSFINHGTTAGVNGDFAVVRLSQPLSQVKPSECPRLPTVEDCATLNLFFKEPNTSLNSISSHFFLSENMGFGSGISAKKLPYPSANLAEVRPTTFTKTANGYFVAQYPQKGTRFQIKKGDSGTGAIWENNGEKILIGVQSGSNTTSSQGYFANLCSHVSSLRWQTVLNAPVVKPGTAPARAASK